MWRGKRQQSLESLFRTNGVFESEQGQSPPADVGLNCNQLSAAHLLSKTEKSPPTARKKRGFFVYKNQTLFPAKPDDMVLKSLCLGLSQTKIDHFFIRPIIKRRLNDSKVSKEDETLLRVSIMRVFASQG